MATTKIASKNNPAGRGQTKEYMYNGEKIKPVKLISSKGSFMAAEYENTGKLVVDQNKNPLPWNAAKI